jgi:hypothetical protein
MRFMTFVKSAEDCGRPPQALVDAMSTAAEEAIRAGILLDTGALASMARSSRIRLSGGNVVVTDGPFAEGKEVVGGYGVVEARSKEEAMEQAMWLVNVHREHWPEWEGEVEVRQILGPEDFAPRAGNP